MIQALHAGLLAAFAGFAGLIAYKLLTGQIDLGDLASHEADGRSAPERLQAVIASAGGAGAYAWMVLSAQAAAASPLTSLPDAPAWLLVGVGASHAVYLAGKLAAPPAKEG